MDRNGLPLPEQVSNLRREFKQLRAQVENLPTKARVINMDWDSSKWGIMSVTGAILIAGLIAFGMYTFSESGVEEARISAQRSSDQERNGLERQAQNFAIDEHNSQVGAEARELATATCARACAVTQMEMIRPLPCMCGGRGQLILFSEDYSSLSRVREVERLEAPPSDPVPEPAPEEQETP